MWVVGGVARTPGRELFFTPVENRSQETLTGILEAWINPGSIINSDKWKGYNTADIAGLGMQAHNTVNHSEFFVDPVTGTHTNTIEGTWNGVRKNSNTRRYRANMIEGDLFSYMWRRRYNGNLWNRLLDAIVLASNL